MRRPHTALRHLCRLMTFGWLCLASLATATTAIMPLGDSITSGHGGYASYRYPLWFDLLAQGHDVEFVGRLDTVHGGPPNPEVYPDYDTGFDRDHEGYWGWRTDEILTVAAGAAAAGAPDIVLIHLGTNDIGQRGEVGLAAVGDNLRYIIALLRVFRPEVTILLAQVIPIGPGTHYAFFAHLVEPMNAIIAAVAEEESTPESPVLLVDQHSGFDLATMMQPDGIHPNALGEARLAAVWQAALAPVLPPTEVAAPVPSAQLALAAWPNPFNPLTTISFAVAAPAPVSVQVLDGRGRLLRTLLSGAARDAGRHQVVWDGRSEAGRAMASGVYLVRVGVGEAEAVQPVTLIR
ncbi:MAG: GDSL-type esterase/lipase family protein [Candidatus Krumholzibacteriia bacterium]